MSKVIEVYVKKEERLKAPADRDYSTYSEHPCQVKYNTEKVLPSEDEKALEAVNDFAKEKECKVRVYDLSSLTGKLKVVFRGVKQTPTIIIDKHRMIGVPKKEDLLALTK